MAWIYPYASGRGRGFREKSERGKEHVQFICRLLHVLLDRVFAFLAPCGFESFFTRQQDFASCSASRSGVFPLVFFSRVVYVFIENAFAAVVRVHPRLVVPQDEYFVDIACISGTAELPDVVRHAGLLPVFLAKSGR